MIHYLLIYVNVLTWRNGGPRLPYQNISVLSCLLLKYISVKTLGMEGSGHVPQCKQSVCQCANRLSWIVY